MGALPKLGVSGAGWGRSCPQALELGFYAVPYKGQPREGGRLKESLVLSPPNFCGRRRCSHRAFTKGASSICLRGCGGLQPFPWCLCSPTIDTQLPSRGGSSPAPCGTASPSALWHIMEHFRTFIIVLTCVLSSSIPHTWKHHILVTFQVGKAWKQNLGAHKMSPDLLSRTRCQTCWITLVWQQNV